MQEHNRLPRRSHRLHQRPRQPSPASENGKQEQYENDAHLTNSLDEGWSLVVGHWSLAIGHLRRMLPRATSCIHPALQNEHRSHLIDDLASPLNRHFGFAQQAIGLG